MRKPDTPKEHIMKKLSEQFLEMSERTAALENRVAATHQENRKEFEAHVAEAQAAVRSDRAAFAARLEKEEESLAAQWRELDEVFAAQISRYQCGMDERLNARDLAHARAQADDAEADAEMAAEFARLTAAGAEEAMLEAKQARAAAQSLEKVRS